MKRLQIILIGLAGAVLAVGLMGIYVLIWPTHAGSARAVFVFPPGYSVGQVRQCEKQCRTILLDLGLNKGGAHGDGGIQNKEGRNIYGVAIYYFRGAYMRRPASAELKVLTPLTPGRRHEVSVLVKCVESTEKRADRNANILLDALLAGMRGMSAPSIVPATQMASLAAPRGR